jgi:hypothetical protein
MLYIVSHTTYTNMQITLAILAFVGSALAGCSDGGRDAPPAVATFACSKAPFLSQCFHTFSMRLISPLTILGTDKKSPAAIDVKNKYIPYFQNLAGQGCGTDGGCCTDMYKNAKMCGAAGGEDCELVAEALRVIVDECTDPSTGLAGGNYVSLSPPFFSFHPPAPGVDYRVREDEGGC